MAPWDGGTAITITGSGFTGATRVAIGGLVRLSVQLVTDTTITCLTPARPRSASPLAVVRVTTPEGTSGDASGAVFTHTDPVAPYVTSTWPLMGPWEGGTTITLKGSGFLLASRVDVGGIKASSLKVIDNQTLTAVTPSRPRGSIADVAVRVTNPFGQSIDGSSGHFSYADPAPPRVTEVSPALQPVVGWPQFTGLMQTTVFGDNLDRVDHAEVDGQPVKTYFSGAYPTIPRLDMVLSRATAGPFEVTLVGRDGTRTQLSSPAPRRRIQSPRSSRWSTPPGSSAG